MKSLTSSQFCQDFITILSRVLRWSALHRGSSGLLGCTAPRRIRFVGVHYTAAHLVCWGALHRGSSGSLGCTALHRGSSGSLGCTALHRGSSGSLGCTALHCTTAHQVSRLFLCGIVFPLLLSLSRWESDLIAVAPNVNAKPGPKINFLSRQPAGPWDEVQSAAADCQVPSNTCCICGICGMTVSWDL